MLIRILNKITNPVITLFMRNDGLISKAADLIVWAIITMSILSVGIAILSVIVALSVHIFSFIFGLLGVI